MKKSDLKTGMLVMQRNGNIQLLVNKTFLCENGGFDELNCYNHDLSSNYDDEDTDITKVSKVLNGIHLGYNKWGESLIDCNLLWKEEVEVFACELDGVTYSQSTLRSIIKKANS
jgi:hypothetical protein